MILGDWFATRGWAPLPFQEETWAAYTAGRSGLVQVPTGAGKTYAAYGGPLEDIATRGGTVLYLGPLRAMARDVERALRLPAEAMGLPVRVEARTGDTPSHARQRQRKRPPEVWVTTPESLSLLLTEPDVETRFGGVRAVIVDEWHELVDSKRGTQVELALARLRTLSPGLRTWALSATVGNVEEVARAVVGAADTPLIVRAAMERQVLLDTLLPEGVRDLPWAGHFGLRMLPRLVAALDPAHPTLVFCNTRAQAERWYQELVAARPDWADVCALHHGSVDLEERARVEEGLKTGALRIVVSTASLDLGVDLAPVERVVQIGSPKGIARLMQRAGRAGHRPGEPCRILCVPTHALQLLEIAAVRDALSRGEVEARTPLAKPLDVLAQHLVSRALGGGFQAEELLAEVRSAWSYRALTDREFEWALALVRDGGGTLRAYPEYRKVTVVDGRYGVPDPLVARLHRSSIGTITGEATLQVRWFGGANLGTIDEGFVSRLRPGDAFVFAGRLLEVHSFRDLSVFVRPAKRMSTVTPHWPGTKLPISGSLGLAMRRVLAAARDGQAEGPELDCAGPLLAEQARLSRIPELNRVLAEMCDTSEGYHLFLYPFEGRSVHEGLAALLAWRLGRRRPATFALAVNDYGIEFLSPAPYDWEDALGPELFSADTLVDDVLASVNASELSRRRFREVARVAGLVHPGLPGRHKPARQVQASASLLFDVFVRYDPENLLLHQARREVVEQQFEQQRLTEALARLRASPLERIRVRRPTPLGVPLVAERLAVDASSSETLEMRLERLKAQWASST